MNAVVGPGSSRSTDTTAVAAATAPARAERVALAALVPAVALAACVEAADPALDELGTVSDPIINGTVVTSDTLGVVKITRNALTLCSGTLLTNQVVLSAGHCFSAADVADPGHVNVSILGGATTTATRIDIQPDEDVARLWLAAPLGGKRIYNPLYSADPALLLGAEVPCFGWGRSSLNYGGSILRTATLRVSRTDPTEYDLAVNAQGQMLWLGDSGGPCTFQLNGTRYVTGVHRNCDPYGDVVDWCTDVAGTASVDWVYSHSIAAYWHGLYSKDLDAAVTWDAHYAYFFRGDEYIKWDIAADAPVPGFPARIATYWPGLFDADLDAAVMWPDGHAYFFRGSEYIKWDVVHDRREFGPAPIADHWPGLFTKDLDAAVVWPTGKAYFFKGDQYIRWDIATDQRDVGPTAIGNWWKGLFPRDLDAIAMWPDGKVYFFKGDRYDRYDVSLDRTDLY